MTEKLYYKDSFLSSFEATVIECRQNGEHYEICLDKTAFFPEGGGQNGDSGCIGEIEVYDTHEKDGLVWHYTNSPIAVDSVQSCKIDFKKRFCRMQCHSGEHIVSGLIHKLFGFENVGFHLSDNDVTIDIDGQLDEKQIREVELLANKAIYENFEIKAWFPTREEAAEINYRSKLEILEGLRLVEFPGYDICACCAPHVKRSGQIGVIKLLDFAHYKGGVRIHLLCGYRALTDYQNKFSAVQNISVLLSAKQDEVFEAVSRLKHENEENTRAIAALRRAIAEEMAKSAAKTSGNLVFFAQMLDTNSLRSLVNSALDKCDGICSAFSGTDGAYNFCMASKSVNLRDKAKEISEALGGRCGGSKEMICGSVTASRIEIEAYLK